MRKLCVLLTLVLLPLVGYSVNFSDFKTSNGKWIEARVSGNRLLNKQSKPIADGNYVRGTTGVGYRVRGGQGEIASRFRTPDARPSETLKAHRAEREKQFAAHKKASEGAFYRLR